MWGFSPEEIELATALRQEARAAEQGRITPARQVDRKQAYEVAKRGAGGLETPSYPPWRDLLTHPTPSVSGVLPLNE